MSVFEKNIRCEDVAPLLVFYACDEVSDKERKQIEAHVAICAACAAQLAEENHLQETMVAAMRPADELDASGILLSQCRSELAEALDDLSAPPMQEHWRPFGWLRRWMALRPAWSGALLVLFGIVVGTQVVPWVQNGNRGDVRGQAMNVTAKPPCTRDQLDNMAIAGVNLSPSSDAGAPNVQLHLSAEQPMIPTGRADEGDMRSVLTYVVENGERFDAGVRLDCLEALKAASRDQQVRQALIAASRKDQNPAVRMKAVNVLVGSLQHGETVENAPEPDDSKQLVKPGSQETDPSVERVVRALQQLQRRDPSPYVRVRSAAALRQIGPREVQ